MLIVQVSFKGYNKLQAINYSLEKALLVAMLNAQVKLGFIIKFIITLVYNLKIFLLDLFGLLGFLSCQRNGKTWKMPFLLKNVE